MTDKQIMTQEHEASAVELSNPVRRHIPAVDIYETDGALVVMADLPGVAEEDLKVEIAQGVLTLEGNSNPGDDASETYYRQFRLSDRVDAEAGEAALKDGVLTLRLPKLESAKPKRIAVKTLH